MDKDVALDVRRCLDCGEVMPDAAEAREERSSRQGRPFLRRTHVCIRCDEAFWAEADLADYGAVAERMHRITLVRGQMQRRARARRQ